MNWFASDQSHRFDRFQNLALGLMGVITLLTFIATNVQALWWQSSDWLVSTVLPAVVVDLTNEERSEHATTPLRRSPTLDAAARQKAQHMAANGYFAHFAPDGTSPWHFFKQAGYTYAHAGENLAIHFTDSAEVVEAWMNSPAHQENIVNQDFVEIGVGTARGTYDGYETVFVVQLFGTPAAPVVPVEVVADDVPSVSNQGASSQPDVVAALPREATGRQSELESRLVDTSTSTPESTELTTISETEVLSVVNTELLPTPTTPVPTEHISVVNKTLVIETELATSSGLAVATLSEPAELHATHAGATVASVMTRPGLVLDAMYSLLIGAVLVLLSISLWGEARRLHYVQAGYSLALLAGVGGLWFAHTLLTSGAVIL